MSDTVEATVTLIEIGDPELHDDDKVAHIVKKADANKGYIGQEMIEALCGYKWIPSKNPDGYPICSKCFAIIKRVKNSGSN